MSVYFGIQNIERTFRIKGLKKIQFNRMLNKQILLDEPRLLDVELWE